MLLTDLEDKPNYNEVIPCLFSCCLIVVDVIVVVIVVVVLIFVVVDFRVKV